MSKKIAVLIKDKQRQYEGLRTSLGLLLEFHTVKMFVLDHEIEITEEYLDNMLFIDEMEGARYSNVSANVGKFGFQPITLDEIPIMLKEVEMVIPY